MEQWGWSSWHSVASEESEELGERYFFPYPLLTFDELLEATHWTYDEASTVYAHAPFIELPGNEVRYYQPAVAAWAYDMEQEGVL
jgi:hypothetical protein